MYLGLLLTAIGGASDATLGLVMGFARKWRWENIWLVWAVFGCLVLPWAVAFVCLTDPSPIQVYRHVPRDALVKTIIFGAGWGVGAILFGLGMVRVGMGLALGIVASLTAAIGALLPLVQMHSKQLLTQEASVLYFAVGLLVLGIIGCSLAAHRRTQERPLLEREKPGFVIGMVYCVLSGFTSPMINLAFTAGIEINNTAVNLGASVLAAGMAPVAPIMTAGFFVNVIYCVYLLNRNRTWSDFIRLDAISHWFYGCAMGLLQMSGFLIYTVAVSRIDKTTQLGGTVLGWPVYTASLILVGNIEGLLRGEWRGADRKTLALFCLGLACVVISSGVVIALGSYLTTSTTEAITLRTSAVHRNFSSG